MSDLNRLRELAQKATPGPWRWVYDSGSLMLHNEEPVGGPGFVLSPHVCETCAKRAAPCLGPSEADASLIVEAVNALPALLDENDRLREALRGLALYEDPPGTLCWCNANLGDRVHMEWCVAARAALESSE